MKNCDCNLNGHIGCDENCNFVELQERYGIDFDIDKLILLRDWCNERRRMIKEIQHLKEKIKTLEK